MKGAILSSVLSASAVAAQLTIGPELLGVAAVNINDPEYTTCSVVADYVGQCVTALGGTKALATADSTAILSCACCVSATPVYPLYSACSSYLSDEGGATFSDSYSAYSVLYSACGAAGICTEGSEPAIETATSEFESETTSESDSEPTSETESLTTSESKNESNSFATTDIPASQTYAVACEDMISVFTSCTSRIDGFTDLPFKEQALCYCCRTADGTLSWTDAMDKYASTCADWAKTGESNTAYSVAKTYATFCERFSDVCGNDSATAFGSLTTDSSAEATDDASVTGDSNTEPVTVTVPQATSTSSSDNGNAAGSLRVGISGTLVAAVLALAIAL